MESVSVSSLLSQLDEESGKLSQFDIQEILDQLKSIINNIQSTHQFNRLVEFIFHGKLTIPQKIFIVKYLLIPPADSSESLSMSLVLKIVGCIGKPMQRGPRAFHKGIPINLQQALLQWLLCSIHFFGEVSKTVKKLLPILFQSLVYEFSRPYLANLIFLATSGVKGSSKPFKTWQIDLVLDLHFRFPSDDSLRVLLALFRWVDPTLSYRGKGTLNLGYVNPQILSYPDTDYLSAIKDINLNKNLLELNLKQYERFYMKVSGRKRVKFSTNADIDLDLDIIDFANVGGDDLISILEVNSLQEVVENLDNIQFVNLKTILTSDFEKDDRFKILYLTLNSDRLSLKLDYYLRLTLLDDNLSLDELVTITNNLCTYHAHGNLPLQSVREFILSKVIPPALPTLEVLQARIKLLRFLSLDREFEESFFNDNCLKLIDAESSKLLIPFVQEVISTYSIWHMESPISEIFIEILNSTLPKLFSLYIPHINQLKVQFSMLSLLNFMKQIDIFHLNEDIHPNTIVLPPTLVYSLVLSPNPLVVSEICGYISSCKIFKFQHKHDTFKSLQNIYIMDILNLAWRDNSFKHEHQEKSYNKAMLLHPRFIHQLSISNVMNYSNLVKFNLIGNIFHNPTWSYLTTEILRKLEDESDNVTIRHAGPPTEESVNDLGESKDEWLDVTYDELKLAILRKLDAMGFDGFANLLFTSLKTLANLRLDERQIPETD
ncbi:hypothetical protein CLIB1423_01S01200 [[Candida] railenensis]|uniref:Uncharacterized protein n=1 Tax=[Candida] railenensis TaxID=45579 RepID=A0A9P0QKC9_9ASCO|nr:hypothetical protein CLIB1423_01S01200 [[Candida] railenensis]